MKTYLEVVDSEIREGRKINTYSYKCVNKTMADSNEWASRTLLFLMLCDSNNAQSTLVPNDVLEIRKMWAARMTLLDLAMEHRDQPRGNLEETYHILLPTEDEMQKFPNYKLKSVGAQIRQSVVSSMTLDSGKLQGHISDKDYKEILKSNNATQNYIDKLLGTGELKADGYDTGIELPAMPVVGFIKPDLDRDQAHINQPSPDSPEVSLNIEAVKDTVQN